MEIFSVWYIAFAFIALEIYFLRRLWCFQATKSSYLFLLITFLGILELLGLGILFNLTVKLITEKRVFDLNLNGGKMLYLMAPSNGEFCSLTKITTPFSSSCCGENKFCVTNISETQETSCTDCGFNYHTFCCNGNKETCGCSQLPFGEARYTQ